MLKSNLPKFKNFYKSQLKKKKLVDFIKMKKCLFFFQFCKICSFFKKAKAIAYRTRFVFWLLNVRSLLFKTKHFFTIFLKKSHNTIF